MLASLSIMLANVILVAGAVGQAANREGKNQSWVNPAPEHRAIPKPRIPEPRIELASEPRKVPAAQSDDPSDGAAAFRNYCLSCHDADKSLKKKKTLAAWQTTVQKMAEKEDADIPERVREPIAQFLARRNAPGNGDLPATRDDSATGEVPSAASAKEKDRGNKQADDSALIQQGTTAFNASCISCHDAEKSLQQTKSLSAWRSCVRRMAEKDGAHTPENTH